MKLNQVDLNLLVALDALLAERSVTGAASKLFVGQPAMSATLARLRQVFGDPLLVRNGRTMTPTPLARSLVLPLRNVLDGVEHVLTLTSAFDPAVDGRSFTLTGSDYVTLVLLRRLLETLDAEAPKVKVIIRPLDFGFQSQLERGEIDLLLVPKEVDISLSRFPHRSLFEDRYVAVVWNAHPSIGHVLTAKMFSEVPQLAYNPVPLPSLAEIMLDELGIERRVEVTTQAFVLAPLLVRGTRLLAMVQERVASELAGASQTRMLELPFATRPITETMYWHPRFEDDPGHRWLRERITTLAATV